MSAHWETPLVLQSLCFVVQSAETLLVLRTFNSFNLPHVTIKNDSSTMWGMYKIAHIYTQVYTRRSWKTQMQRTRNRKHSAGRNYCHNTQHHGHGHEYIITCFALQMSKEPPAQALVELIPLWWQFLIRDLRDRDKSFRVLSESCQSSHVAWQAMS